MPTGNILLDMNEATKIGVSTWLLAVLLYGLGDSGMILFQEATTVSTYYTPLAVFGMMGILVVKGFVLLAALLIFPLCRSISSEQADYIPPVFSAVIASIGLYLLAQKLLFTQMLGFGL